MPDPIDEERLYAMARNAGLPEGRVMNVLLLRAKEYGLEKALLRAIAELIHDARPVGKIVTMYEMMAVLKTLSTCQATARRLAEIGAAPR